MEEVMDGVRQYFKVNGLFNTLQTFDAQREGKNRKQHKNQEHSRLYNLIKNHPNKSKKQVHLEKDLKELNKKFKWVLNAGKQVFSVSINLLQLLHTLKQPTKNQSLAQAIQSYKSQLTKYHKVITNEGKPENMEVTEHVMMQHKQKLFKYFYDRNIDGVKQVLLSFRVNALQIAPQLRKNLAYELIRNDILNIEQSQLLDFPIGLLQIPNNSLRYALTAFLSILSSTLRGVEYLTFNNNFGIIQKMIKITKQSQNGIIIQRFTLAFLQKSSVKDSVVPTMVEMDMINWIITLIKKSMISKMNQFCLDFASATLANIIHCQSTLDYLQSKPQYCQKLMQIFLKLMRDNIPVSVLMHILICLSYLSKQPFQKQIQVCRFVERISEFVEYYSQINTSQNQAAEIDKRTVLDLCAHMFHPKDASLQNSQTMQLNQLKTQDRIRQYQNDQGQLIFECFQDQPYE